MPDCQFVASIKCHAVYQHAHSPRPINATCSQDHWWLSGISRDVLLVAKPATHISDFRVLTPLTFADGSLELTGARCCHLDVGLHGQLRGLTVGVWESFVNCNAAAHAHHKHCIEMVQTGDQDPWRGRVSSFLAGRASPGHAAQH